MSHITFSIPNKIHNEMKKHPEIRWSAVMKKAAKEKLHALVVLERFAKKSKLSEQEIHEFAIKLGKKITDRK